MYTILHHKIRMIFYMGWHIENSLVFGFLVSIPMSSKHSFISIGYEIFSTAILSILLIKVGHLTVTGERMCSE